MSTEIENLVHVTPSQALKGLKIAMDLRKPLLLVGAPGVGKSDIALQAADEMEHDLILSHPALGDPTDAKGLPWPDAKAGVARFLPFGDLQKALTATRPTLWFLDDLGQANGQAQSAWMQLLLAREINGQKLPDCVTFAAATNRRGDRANVNGILEPVKSRFLSILHLRADLEEWLRWGYRNGMHPMVLAFLQLCPDLLHSFKPNVEIVNYPCPRTWANVSALMRSELMDSFMAMPMFSGAVGMEAATQFTSFMKVCEHMPVPEIVLASPDTAPLPENLSVQYALSTALVSLVTPASFPLMVRYAERLQAERGASEMAVTMLKTACKQKPELTKTSTYVELATGPLGNQMA